jgi:hypothetical protein
VPKEKVFPQIFFQDLFLTSLNDDFVDDIEPRKLFISYGNVERGNCVMLLKSCPLETVTGHSSVFSEINKHKQEDKNKTSYVDNFLHYPVHVKYLPSLYVQSLEKREVYQ